MQSQDNSVKCRENGIVVDDIFKVYGVNLDGQHFDGVARINAKSESFKMDLMLDVNCALLPMRMGAKFRFMLATTLHEDGSRTDPDYDPTASLGARAESFEYIMHGIVYRVEDEYDETHTLQLSTYCSFGGLLMRLQGQSTFCNTLTRSQGVYVLIKVIAY